MTLRCYRCAAWPCVCKDNVTILQGDCRTILPLLPDESVHCCVTSPPYWGLRDYGTASWEGGDAGCDHQSPSRKGATGDRADRTFTANAPYRDTCGKCGARRIDAQLGLEPTYQEYVQHMVEVFREVRRVLRDDGTLWLNLGDSYNNFRSQMGPGQAVHGRENLNGKPAPESKRRGTVGLKEKDLCGIPWRVAFALQEDGWYLRQDIIWHKPNPMPESVRDRCTKAHEYIFLLSKSQRYYYDQDAIKEESSGMGGGASFGPQTKKIKVPSGWDTSKGNGGHGSYHSGGRGKPEYKDIGVQSRTYDRPEYDKRNKRSVWTVATHSYPDAHFATFPPELIEPCIHAGCPQDGTVLDPFHGSGTTGEVSRRFGCRYVGIELNSEYIGLSLKRLRQGTMALSD